jgi:hypothetical protein
MNASTPLPTAVHVRRFLTAIAVVLLASWLGSRVQNSGGRVQVMDIRIPTQNGQWVVADLYRPRTATAETPAPLVVVVPGFQRSKEALGNISLELARRGVVVIAIDPYAQGASSASQNSNAATTEGYGMFAVVDYVANTPNLNYVDKTRIGVTGHSAGGNAAIRGASFFGKQAKKSGKPSVLHSVFVSGYILTLTDAVLKDVRSNVGISYALYDEGAYRNERQNGDMRRAPEALRLVNAGAAAGVAKLTEVEIGRYYGDLAERSLRVVHNEPLLHPLQPYAPSATANQVEYFDKVFALKHGLAATDQVWFWKDVCGLAALVAALVALVPLAGILLGLPWFQTLVKPVPPALPRPRGVGRIVFWSLFVAGALVACFTYIPMSELSQRVFVAASNREPTWFFPQRMNNAVLMWALFNGTVGFVLFFLSYHFFGKRHGARAESWGAQTGAGELARTAGLAVTLAFSFFLLLFMVYGVFHVDYRSLFMGARVFQPEVVPQLAMYAPGFFVFFLSNSLRMNGALRLAGQPEWRSLLLGGLANSLGLLLILIIQYGTLARTGTVYWTDGWLYINLLFAVVPMMFVLPYFNRYFFRLTGRIYLGPMTTCLVFITILLTNTVSYLPL